jgi:hypothetical protein
VDGLAEDRVDGCVDGSVEGLLSAVDAAFSPIVSFRPGWISEGSPPMAWRLSE